MTEARPKTFGEALDRIHRLQDKIAVYEDLSAYLTPFISTDSHTPAQGIKSPVRQDEPVEEGIIIKVQEEMGPAVSRMNKEVSRLRGMGLSVKAKKAPVKKTVKAPPKRRVKK